MKDVSIYLAGGLFNAAERVHNSTLEKNLIEVARDMGINLQTTLPQRTALKRYLPNENRFDVAGIVADCEVDAASHDYILCNLDGTDADSGTAVELGVARGQALAYQKLSRHLKTHRDVKIPKIITYRTDFRTSIENEVGVNAMLNPEGSTFIYHPCFVTELGEVESYYKELASKITDVIQKG
ncbi:MAG: nucleoside 2-deoxyribosyltransferase [Nanoarchaeota archaeon]|nr:nucleoside 2-deoxyribosyltransferase [Nanoarchaeota archaeon]